MKDRICPPAWPAMVAAAQACAGTRFRAQGRIPGLGLDCVGVVLIAARAAGIAAGDLPAYALGGDHEADIEPALAKLGCWVVTTPLPADVLVIAPSPRQRHLAIVTPAGIVHAHAGLGRVVEGPVDASWAVLRAWRMPGAR